MELTHRFAKNAGFSALHRAKSRRSVRANWQNRQEPEGSRAIDPVRGWRNSCPGYRRVSRVSSSSSFDRADAGRWAERWPAVQGLVSRGHVDGVPASGLNDSPRACAPTTIAPPSQAGPSRLSARTAGARPRTPRAFSLFFGSDSSPHQLTHATAMSRGGSCCSKNDLSLSPSESKSLRRSRRPAELCGAVLDHTQGRPARANRAGRRISHHARVTS